MHIPFVKMVKFQFLAHFSVDYFPYPAVPSLAFLMCQLATFTYVINCVFFFFFFFFVVSF